MENLGKNYAIIYAFIPMGFVLYSYYQIIAYSTILGLREDKSCNNKTWLMGCIVLGTHCAEILIGIIVIVLANVFNRSISVIEQYVGILAKVWSFYFLALFIVVQVFLFSKENDCKDSTV